MDLIIRALAVCTLLCGTALGQANAIVEGPNQSQAGNLVVLTSEGSQADATEWIIPESLQGRSLTFGPQLAFAVRESGSFTFHLVAVSASETVEIDVATHTVVITDGFGQPPGGDPSPPDEPSPTPPDEDEPPADFKGLEKISRDAAVSLSDPGTARKLATAIRSVEMSSLDQMRVDTRDAIEAALLNRDGDSESKPWLSEWRRPVDEALDSAGITSPERYRDALDAVANGLEAAADSVPEPKPGKQHRVVMYSRSDCGWCLKWKERVQPELESAGWTVEIQTSTGTVPQFDVIVGDRVERLVGYQGVEDFSQFMRHLRRAYDRLRSY